MPQPSPYDRITNFQNDQALHPTDPYPAPLVDAEYNAIKITTDEILQNLLLIQRDDGQLANDSVGFDQLRDEIFIGFNAPKPWETNFDYIPGDTVFQDSGFWYCMVAHKSSVFSDDVNAGYWSLIADFSTVVTTGAPMFVSDGPPALPHQGVQWYESDTGNTYIWYIEPGETVGQWVQINGAANADVSDNLTLVSDNATAAPVLNAKGYVELLNAMPGNTGGQLWFSTEPGNPYAMIGGYAVTGPSPYNGDVVFANRNAPTDPLVNRLWFARGGALISEEGTLGSHGVPIPGNTGFAAVKDTGASALVGYSDTTNDLGTSIPCGAYLVGSQTVAVSSGVMGAYIEGNTGVAATSWGAEIDAQNWSGLAPYEPNPNILHGGAPLVVSIISQAGGTKIVSSAQQKNASAWAYVSEVTANSVAVGFIRGLIFGKSSLKSDATGHKEALSLSAADSHEITWWNAAGSAIGRLYSSDGVALSWNAQTVATTTGVTDASVAAAGKIGEVIADSATGVSLSHAAQVNIASITLTPGCWDVYGSVGFNFAATTTVGTLMASVSTTSGAITNDLTNGSHAAFTYPAGSAAPGAGSATSVPVGPRRINISASTTVYLVSYQTIGSGTLTATGWIRGNRIR